MKSKITYYVTAGLAGIAMLSSAAVSAAPVLCKDAMLNHMNIDNSQVTSCLDAGDGNINGNPMGMNPDPFLTGAGMGYETASLTDGANPYNLMFTQNNGTGEWAFDSTFWDDYSAGAIGFKFGTGNKSNEWFVYALVSDISSGEWAFVNVFRRGGGLSHVNLYGIPDGHQVPEPSVLTLFGLGLIALGARGYRRKKT